MLEKIRFFFKRIDLAIDALISLGNYNPQEVDVLPIRIQSPQPFINPDLRKLYHLIGMVDRLQSVENRGIGVSKLKKYLLQQVEDLIGNIDLS